VNELPLIPDVGPPPDVADAATTALWYHERTKHHLRRYARSAGSLDWATQPDPFRTFSGAPTVPLPLVADRLTPAYADLYRPGAVAPQPVGRDTVAALFELSLGLSAWKEFGGNRWALRCNPSSGNLHPTEGYAVLPAVPGLIAGVYHYVSRDHLLERRCTLSIDGVRRLAGALPPGAFLIGLSSIHWREAWKYGERAFRYCQHDVGHAVAAVRTAAAVLGWSAVLLDTPGDADMAALLGLDRPEAFAGVEPGDREHPDVLLLVGPNLRRNASLVIDTPAVLDGSTWAGKANPLSPTHVHWGAIDAATVATAKPPTPPVGPVAHPELPPLSFPADGPPAAQLIRQRRSCLALDGQTSISAETFFHILDRLLPPPGVPPWDAVPWAPLVHAALFVHRVRGLRPGLYLLQRSADVHDRLRAATRAAFAWARVPAAPEHLPLFLLAEDDLREVARVVSCHQEIASDGAFSLGMIAEFGDILRQRGAWWYRRLFWEAGVLGQVLYLEAEAAGVRGTGIGCYFDDPMHELLGLTGDRFQSLYHFTAGGPVDDPRLRTRAPYAHLGPPGGQRAPMEKGEACRKEALGWA
jgi:SagB-type dehydrogenase family enzyme